MYRYNFKNLLDLDFLRSDWQQDIGFAFVNMPTFITITDKPVYAAITGTAGDDVFVGTASADDYDGLAGIDTVDYSGSVGAVLVDLLLGTGVGAYAAGDTYINIENVIGTFSGDRIIGSGEINDLRGGDGHDYITGNGGDDWVYGDTGNDLLVGNGGRDRLFGGTGDDRLFGQAGNDALYGNAGNDRMGGGLGNDVLFGHTGEDILDGGIGDDILRGGGGDDRLVGGTGNDRLYGDAGDDRLFGDAGADQMFGGAGNDWLVAGIGNDVLDGGTDDDDLFGQDGDDTLTGGAGNDRLVGDTGNDDLSGGAGNDRLFGGTGNDTLNGGRGNDRLFGGTGDDMVVLNGASINDYTVDIDPVTGIVTITDNVGADGIDKLFDVEFLQVGSDVFAISEAGLTQVTLLTEGDDVFQGTIFDDIIFGLAGDDVIDGSDGNDTIYGGEGNDLIIGGNGDDTIDGGSGEDRVILPGGSDDLYIINTNAETGIVTATYGYYEFGFPILGATTTLVNVELLTAGGRTYYLGPDPIYTVNLTDGDDAYSAMVLSIVVNGLDGDDFLSAARGYVSYYYGYDGTGIGTYTIEPSNAMLNGGAGNDRLVSYGGTNTLTGGVGADVFAVLGVSGFLAYDLGYYGADEPIGSGWDVTTVITDFTPGEDVIELYYGDFSSLLNDASDAVDVNGNNYVEISYRPLSYSNAVYATYRLLDVTVADLQASDFVFLGDYLTQNSSSQDNPSSEDIDVFVGKPVVSDLVSDELVNTGKAVVSEDDSFDFGADKTVIPVSEDLVFDPEDMGMSKAELRAVFLEAVAQDVYVHNDEAIDIPDFDFMLDFWG